ncbi:MAG: hypothetical protein GY822_31340 [Deltaproteobacteria bacterium]|nr:hypothetical protein [Deltaproteobacteria bacterium]
MTHVDKSSKSAILSLEEFTEALLQIMERKQHWGWKAFTCGDVPNALHHIHMEQEWEVFVRDFPVLLGWAFVQCPDAAVRRDLAENLYEEETGGLVAKKPHPELFMMFPAGLGYDLSRFDDVQLLPRARLYRAVLDDAVRNQGWEAAVAVSTLFVEGTPFERGEIDASAEKRPAPPLEDHPLVKHYGLDVKHLELVKAHRHVEGEHRVAAWRMVTQAIPADQRAHVVAVMEAVLLAWKAYRDDVCEACGLKKSGEAYRVL